MNVWIGKGPKVTPSKLMGKKTVSITEFGSIAAAKEHLLAQAGVESEESEP
jgi:hypothetical protein